MPSPKKTQWEDKLLRDVDFKGKRRARPFAGTVPREFGPKLWPPGVPPGGEVCDGQNPPAPGTNSASGDASAQSQESSNSSE